MKWIDNYKNEELLKIEQNHSSKSTIENKRRKLSEKCSGYKIIVEQFCEKKYNPIVDSSGFRLHTILTRLKKELRQFVTYDGQNVVAIDISCSQPYLSLILLNNEFWDKKPTKGKKGFREMNKSNYERVHKAHLTDPYTIMLRENGKILYQSDIQLQEYIQLVITGGLYEYLMDILSESRKSEVIKFDRSIAKKMVLKAFYCNERLPNNQQCDSYNLIFKRTFPTMGRLFSIVKAEDYKGLAILLQRVESYVVLERICKRISVERPDLPLFTIHDSIVTTEGNEGYIEKVMGEELLNYVGYPAHFKIERWGEPKKQNRKINYTLIGKNNEYRLAASNGF